MQVVIHDTKKRDQKSHPTLPLKITNHDEETKFSKNASVDPDPKLSQSELKPLKNFRVHKTKWVGTGTWRKVVLRIRIRIRTFSQDPDPHSDPRKGCGSGPSQCFQIPTIHKNISTENCQSYKIKILMEVTYPGTYQCLMGPD